MNAREQCKQYSAIHHWLKYHYGRADKCENPNCAGKSTNYCWARKHGCAYENNRANFIQLCYSCHGTYDMTDESRLKNREHNRRTNRLHCANGHPFTLANTSVTKQGWRRCRTCDMNNDRRYRERIKNAILDKHIKP